MDVQMSLNVKCTSEDTMDVTSDDLILDASHPDVHPVGEYGGLHYLFPGAHLNTQGCQRRDQALCPFGVLTDCEPSHKTHHACQGIT